MPTCGKDKLFYPVKYSPLILESLFNKFLILTKNNGSELDRVNCSYTNDAHENISINDADEFYRLACFGSDEFTFTAATKDHITMRFNYKRAALFAYFENFKYLHEADELMQILNTSFESSKLPLHSTLKSVQVFIGHGRSRLWRDLKDHLQDHHGIKVIAYETGVRTGSTIQEVLEDLKSRATIAFLVLTGEDTPIDGEVRARENVVHETGLLQGKLGFKRAIVLLEQGTSEFSNIAGLQQIRFQKGNIKEAFGDVLAVLRREFGDHQ